MEPIIQAKNLDFIYNKGKDNEYHALINISLDIYQEEYVIVFGPSGCGKSTLLNVIAGLEQPDSGNILVFGKDLTKMSKNDFARYHRRDVGMIYQAYNLITSLTVLDNVTLPQMFVSVNKGKRDKWGKQLLERFGILKQAKKIPTELSGGQQQRIGIARAIVNNPRLVLADEPVGNLDSVSAKNVLEILANLNEKEKKTIVMVTHNPENLQYGDRIIYMKDGIITREVVNHNKGKKRDFVKKTEMVPKSPTAEISDLMRAYHGLSPEQINILIMPYKAKVFAHHFITTRNMEETKIFEEVVQRRLLGTISQDEFFDILNRPSREGGVGFDKRTAEKVMRRITRVIRMAFFVYQKGRQRKNEQGEHIRITQEEKTAKVLDYLLKTVYYKYYHHLNETQMSRLTDAVSERLEGNLQKGDFNKYLDKSFADGGVGLNVKTAKAITEELELILILGFGIVRKEDGDDEGNTGLSEAKKVSEQAENKEQEYQKNKEEDKHSAKADSEEDKKREQKIKIVENLASISSEFINDNAFTPDGSNPDSDKDFQVRSSDAVNESTAGEEPGKSREPDKQPKELKEADKEDESKGSSMTSLQDAMIAQQEREEKMKASAGGGEVKEKFSPKE